MVVCRFFQQGSCRFGTKCSNEHFDIKVVLKNDMEASINGKMWPFSVYGPFKDKANMPNFIEDQSFEEVRLLCYESKRLNSFEQFHQQFNREVMEATNKMKAMVQVTPQIIDVLIKIYDTPEGGSAAVASAPNQNPFAATAANAPGSIFGKSTLAGVNQVNNTQNLFGGSMASGSSASSIFGGAIVAGAPSVFGQPQQQQPQQQVAGAQHFQGGNLFAQPQAQVQVQAQPQPQAAFGGFQQQQPGGVFGQAAVNPSGGIFGQVAQQPQQPPNGLFAQAAQPVGFPQQQQQQAQQMMQQQQQQVNPQQQQQLLQQQQQQQMMQQQQQQQMMQQQQQQQQPQPAGSSVYSAIESLTPAEIEAFKADQFQPGHVPFNPPPREFC